MIFKVKEDNKNVCMVINFSADKSSVKVTPAATNESNFWDDVTDSWRRSFPAMRHYQEMMT